MGVIRNERKTIAIYNPETLTAKNEIEPQNFSCSVSKNGNNGLSFSYPLSKGLLDVGDLVWYDGTIFGGQITARDIDTKTKVVKYSGVSWWGMLDHYVCEIGDQNRTVTIESELSHPGCQTMLSGTTTGGIPYPNNGPYPLIHYIRNHFALPYYVFEPDYLIDLPEHHVIYFTVPLGTTLSQLVRIIEDATSYNVTLEVDLYNGILELSFRFRAIKTYTDNYNGALLFGEEEDMILTEELRKSAVFDHNTMHYLANDGTYKSAFNVIDNWPSDLEYEGYSQFTYWSPNTASNEVNQRRLKNERELDMAGKISSEIKVPYERYASQYGINGVNIGDYVDYTSKKIKNIKIHQKLTGKTLSIENGGLFVKCSFGG